MISMTDKEIEMYDYMVEIGMATPQEINLVKNIHGGSWEEVLNAIVHVRTGYQSLEQYMECELNEDEE